MVWRKKRSPNRISSRSAWAKTTVARVGYHSLDATVQIASCARARSQATRVSGLCSSARSINSTNGYTLDESIAKGQLRMPFALSGLAAPDMGSTYGLGV